MCGEGQVSATVLYWEMYPLKGSLGSMSRKAITRDSGRWLRGWPMAWLQAPVSLRTGAHPSTWRRAVALDNPGGLRSLKTSWALDSVPLPLMAMQPGLALRAPSTVICLSLCLELIGWTGSLGLETSEMWGNGVPLYFCYASKWTWSLEKRGWGGKEEGEHISILRLLYPLISTFKKHFVSI